ncbi:MAG: stealth conserved region 3 domain-containing protein [Liquorilactobacillus hordei]|uniref:stealth conserved region 3 domain-containing protein n=1 Tax=Liquorilactobacillus hordei TaxID=468911 RepID=UPI0039E8D3D4
MNEEIDFVVLWVDDRDYKWQLEKQKFQKKYGVDNSNAINRYRDWDNMKYWFRSVEKFAPWVRKIHFVTYGHLPKFLNIDAPKLHIVKHEDFIDKKYLPLFNSCAIEINIHKIPGLSDKFVYFNDDMFLLQPVKPTDFFRNELPCYEGLQGTITSVGDGNSYAHQLLNDINIINKNFNKKEQINKNFLKWYNYRYGFESFRNLLLSPWKKFTGFKNAHLPAPYLKSTFEELWLTEKNSLLETCEHRFRSYYDLNQYVFRYWQLAKGEFYPKLSNGKRYEVSEENIANIKNEIVKQKHREICINDPENDINFEALKKEINEAFTMILKVPSSFEK